MEGTRAANRPKDLLHGFSLFVVVSLLILAAIGDSELMFLLALVGTLLSFVWFVAERKVWLALVSGVAFAITIILTAKSLF